MGVPAAGGPPWLSGMPGAWRLVVHAVPGAFRSAVAGEHDGCLKLRIAAPPIDGLANDALCAFLAARLALPRSAIEIEQGTASRRKRLRVAAGCDAATLVARLSD